jgi:hypothetical protein
VTGVLRLRSCDGSFLFFVWVGSGAWRTFLP